MIDARIELAPNSRIAPLRSQRLATTGVFVANGMGIGCWAAAIPRIKADLALSDATLSVALLSFAAGAIIAMPLMGLFAHRLRSGPASIIAGLGFAAVLAALGFAGSLEALSAATFLAGATHGATDVAMNANASDLERRWGRPIMSSFHAGFSLGGAAGAVLGGWFGELGTVWGLLGPALIAALLVAVAAPFVAREGGGFGGAAFAAPSRRLLPLAALAFVLDVDRRRGWRLERNLSRALGRRAGRRGRRLRGLFAIDGHRQDCRRSDRRRCGSTRDGWPGGPHRRGGARNQRRVARTYAAASSASGWLARASPTLCLSSSASLGGRGHRRRLESLRPRPRAMPVC